MRILHHQSSYSFGNHAVEGGYTDESFSETALLDNVTSERRSSVGTDGIEVAMDKNIHLAPFSSRFHHPDQDAVV